MKCCGVPSLCEKPCFHTFGEKTAMQVPHVSDPVHPTNPHWVLNDIRFYPAPKGVELLCLTKTGRLVISFATEDTVAWGYKPQAPQTVKARERALAKHNLLKAHD